MIKRSEIFKFAIESIRQNRTTRFSILRATRCCGIGATINGFCLVMDVPEEKRELERDEVVDAVDVKCRPEHIDFIKKAARHFAGLSHEKGTLGYGRAGWLSAKERDL